MKMIVYAIKHHSQAPEISNARILQSGGMPCHARIGTQSVLFSNTEPLRLDQESSLTLELKKKMPEDLDQVSDVIVRWHHRCQALFLIVLQHHSTNPTSHLRCRFLFEFLRNRFDRLLHAFTHTSHAMLEYPQCKWFCRQGSSHCLGPNRCHLVNHNLQVLKVNKIAKISLRTPCPDALTTAQTRAPSLNILVPPRRKRGNWMTRALHHVEILRDAAEQSRDKVIDHALTAVVRDNKARLQFRSTRSRKVEEVAVGT